MTEHTARVQVEAHGADAIPDAERTSRPRDLISLLVGPNLALGVMIFGWLPVSYGLNFWASVSSMLVGALLGTALVAPLALVSLHTATNLSTSSGGHFGVRGRLLGSAIGLLLSLGYAALALWTGGSAVVEPLHRTLGLPNGDASYIVVYALLALLTVLGAVFGYQLLVRVGRWLTLAAVALVACGVLAYAGDFTTAPVVPHYALGGFWPTWALSTVVAGLSAPIAFVTILGDYTRYISPRRHSRRSVVGMSALALLIGLLLPQLFGVFTAYAARAGEDYVSALVLAAPAWYLPLLLVNGLFGTVGNAGLLLYSMGLDLDAIVPRISRIGATGVASLAATVLVFLGHFVWDAQDAVTAFVVLLTALAVPWAVVTLIGYVRCRGRYDIEALQVLNRRSRGGLYWYWGGWNPQAVVSWAIGSTVGLLSVDTTVYEGPLVQMTGGIDLSVVLAAVATAVPYALLTLHRPPPLPANTPSAARTRDTSCARV